MWLPLLLRLLGLTSTGHRWHTQQPTGALPARCPVSAQGGRVRSADRRDNHAGCPPGSGSGARPCTTRLLVGRVFLCPAPRRIVDEVRSGRCQEGRYMVSSQFIVGNRNPKLFSQLNELYGSARTVQSVAMTTGSSSSPSGRSSNSPTEPSAGPPRPDATTPPNPPGTRS